MFDRFTDRAKKIMSLSREAALGLNHEYIGVEHILLGLVREGTGVAANVLKNMEQDLDEIDSLVEDLVKPGRRAVDQGQLPFTPRAKKVLELSMEAASGLSHNYIGSEHLLLGLVAEGGGIAAQVLQRIGVSLEDARAEIMEFIGEVDPQDDFGPPPATRMRTTSRRVWTHWYDEGGPQSEGGYVSGQRQGYWTFWHEDGSVDEERTGWYEDGARTRR